MKIINLVLTVIGMSGLFLGFTAQARDLKTLTLREHAIIAAANAILEEHQSQSYKILVGEIGEQKATGYIENILVPRGGGGRTQNCTNEKKLNPQASFKLYSRSPSQETEN